MTAVYRNIVKGFSFGRSWEIARHNAAQYNEVWFVLLDAQIAANARGRRGYEQFDAIACYPDGRQETVPANPRA